MLQHVARAATAATPLFKRVDELPPDLSEIPKWLWGLFVVDFIVLIPIFFFVSYTIGSIFPVLAIVEDEKASPTYQAIPAGPEDVEADPAAAGTLALDPALSAVNSSLRRIHKLLRSHGGWRTYFRGILCLLAISVGTAIVQPVVAAVMRPAYLEPLSPLVSYLALAQFHTAWVHIVITPGSARHFFQRLPPFAKAVKANMRPAALFVVAAVASTSLPPLLARVFGVPYPIRPWTGDRDPSFADKPVQPLGLILLGLLQLAMYLGLVLPTYVALIRVQASLLPPEQDAIVAFDRSFGGRVEPAVVASGEEGGRGYATLRDVWETFTGVAVRRLSIVMLKVLGIHVAVAGVLVAVLAPQIDRVRKSGLEGSIF